MNDATTALLNTCETSTTNLSNNSRLPHGSIPSLIKWTGSKRSQASRIARRAPSHNRYYEPFLGGGRAAIFAWPSRFHRRRQIFSAH